MIEFILGGLLGAAVGAGVAWHLTKKSDAERIPLVVAAVQRALFRAEFVRIVLEEISNPTTFPLYPTKGER